jgi:hypothetical protein
MPKSLQQIEDYYLTQGLTGKALRKAIENDSEYQQIWRERKKLIKDKLGVSNEDEKKYVLSRQEDYEILSKVRELESKSISDVDKEFVQLIRTQLEEEWRNPLVDKLNKLLEKYP